MAHSGAGLHGITWQELADDWSWGALAAHSWKDFFPVPTYRVRAGFTPATWTEINSNYTWAQLSGSFFWPEINAGPVTDTDIKEIRFDRRIATLFERMTTGKADVLLVNDQQDYTPEAIVGSNSLKIGQVLAIKAVTHQDSVYSLFSGLIDRYSLRPALEARETLVQASDRSVLLRRTINMGLEVDTKISSLVSNVLSASGVNSEYWDVSGVVDDVSFAFFDQQSAGDAINEVIRAGAFFSYVSGAGRFTFRDRNFDFALDADASYTEFSKLNYALSDERILNDVRVSGQPRKASDVSTVAWLEDTVTLPASGGTVSFFLEFLDPDTLERQTPVNSLVTPVSSSDYLAFANSDGTGTILNSQLAVAVTPFAMTAFSTITNNGGVDAFLSKYQLRGIPLKKLPSFTARTQNTSSQNVYDVKAFDLENDLIPTVLKATDYSNYLTSRWKDPRAEISIGLVNEWPDLLQRELLDRLTVINSVTRVGSDFLVSGLEHTIVFDAGVQHQVEFDLLLSDLQNYLILDDATRGKLDGINLLGF